MNAPGSLLASSLDAVQRTALHGLLCRAFADRELAADVADGLGLALDPDVPLDLAWLRVIDRLRTTRGDIGPLAALTLRRLPDDREWRRVPALDALRALAVRLPRRAKTEPDGRPLVLRVTWDSAPVDAWGSAWRLDRSRALTAAHCVGDRRLQELRSPRHWLEDAAGDRHEAAVADVDWDLDAALLVLREPVDDGAFPALARAGAGDPWRVWGFPRANPSGMVIAGEVTDVSGAVANAAGDGTVPALQLTCAQGGEGDLEGCSGAPVWGRGGVVGMVRWGTLRQRVIYATSTASLTARFALGGVR